MTNVKLKFRIYKLEMVFVEKICELKFSMFEIHFFYQ